MNFLKRKLSGNKKSKKKKLPKKSTDGGGKKRKKSEGKKRQVNGNYKIKKKEEDGRASGNAIEKKPKWKVYSLKGCPYCDKVKDVLNEKGIDFDYKEFGSLPEQEQTKILESMDKVRNGFRTYPRVFSPTADNKSYDFIGGYNDTCTYLKN